MKNPFIKKHATSISLLLLCILSYGLLIPWLGLYWDDWVYTWFGYVLGPAGYAQAFANDRPFLSLIYMLTTSILGQNPIAWQISGLLLRWALALLFHRLLTLVWPQKEYQQPVWLASALFAIYPGFSQHHISVIYSQAYILFGFFVGSLICMISAIRSKKKYWLLTLAGLGGALISHLSTEYFFGLEFIRPFFIWIIIPGTINSFGGRIKFIIRQWIPYLFISLAYLIFRYMQTVSPEYEGYEFSILGDNSTGGIQSILIFLQEILSTILKAGIQAWTQATRLFSFPLDAASTWLYFGVMGIGFLIIFFFGLFLYNKSNQNTGSDKDVWGIFSIITGLAAILLGRMPSWIAGLPFGLEFPYDRFLLSTSFGGSLLAAGLIQYFINPGRRRIIISALILSSAIGWNFYTSNTFRRDWQNQTAFFQQLTWRIPAITPDTIVLTHELPLKYYSDNSLTAPLNWIYSPDFDGKTGQMPYIFIYTKIRLGQSLESLAPGQQVDFNFRAFSFKGSTNHTISIYHPGNACLRVLDSAYTDQNVLPNLPPWYEDLIPLTDLDRIIPDPGQQAVLPAMVFPESENVNWCYYFQKAELARQIGDYASVVSIMENAQRQGFKPISPSEQLVFIEGYAVEGELDTAQHFSEEVLNSEPDLANGLCKTWNRIKTKRDFTTEEIVQIDRIINGMNCTLEDT